jgi:hypothetical protein
MGIEVGGLLGLIILIADVWAIVKTFGSSAPTSGQWLLILGMSLIPLIICLVTGPLLVKKSAWLLRVSGCGGDQ